MRQQKAGAQYCLRSGTSVVTFWIGAVVLVIVMVVPLLRADWRVFLFVMPPSLLLLWLLWMVLLRPAIRYSASGVMVRNIGRTHQVPWHRVVSIRQHLGIDFELDGTRVVRAIAVPPPRRASNIASAFDRHTRPPYDYNRYVEILEGFRLNAVPTADPVTSRWDVVAWSIGAVLLAAVVLSRFVTI